MKSLAAFKKKKLSKKLSIKQKLLGSFTYTYSKILHDTSGHTQKSINFKDEGNLNREKIKSLKGRLLMLIRQV